jgi:hypothetical protein
MQYYVDGNSRSIQCLSSLFTPTMYLTTFSCDTIDSYAPASARTFCTTGGIAVNTTSNAPNTLPLVYTDGTYAKLRLLSAAARGSVVSN